MHEADADAPVAARKKPAAQPVHTAVLTDAANAPAAQLVQLAKVEMPVVAEYSPAGQPVH